MPAVVTTQRRVPPVAAYRSGLEDTVSRSLTARGVPGQAIYESRKILYTKPAKASRYTPDFPLPNGIVVETKGLFTAADRLKHLFIQGQYPDLDLRFVFSNPRSKIAKGSKTTYADWCGKHGFRFAHRDVPDEWLAEPPNAASRSALL
jgi:hypothetical protein